MTEEYFRQQVHISTIDKTDEQIIDDYRKTAPDQAALASKSRFDVIREGTRAILYILWGKSE